MTWKELQDLLVKQTKQNKTKKYSVWCGLHLCEFVYSQNKTIRKMCVSVSTDECQYVEKRWEGCAQNCGDAQITDMVTCREGMARRRLRGDLNIVLPYYITSMFSVLLYLRLVVVI